MNDLADKIEQAEAQIAHGTRGGFFVHSQGPRKEDESMLKKICKDR